MKLFCLLISTLLCSAILGQINSVQLKKIRKVIGKDFAIGNKAENYYRFNLQTQCAIDTSTTIVGDTIGVTYENEYVLFRSPIRYIQDTEVLKLVSPSLVKVEEWDDFQSYVKDSIARLKIFYLVEDDRTALQYLNIKDISSIHPDPDFVLEPSCREGNHEHHYFNLEKKFSYIDPELVPILADMYRPMHSRFYKKRIFDDRKFTYDYTFLSNGIRLPSKYELLAMEVREKYELYGYFVDNKVNLKMNSYAWSTRSIWPHDIFSVMGQLYQPIFKDEAVIGITGVQAEAFCHWKQKGLQKEFDKKKLPYRVVITLPEKNDIAEISNEHVVRIEKRDFTDQWRISMGDYIEFIVASRDSVYRETLYLKLESHKEANRFLKYSNSYFKESHLEWQEFDPTDRIYNRQHFPLNYKTAINRRKWEIDSLLSSYETSTRFSSAFFRYYFIDAKSKSNLGVFEIEPWYESVTHYRYESVRHPCDSEIDPPDGWCIGMDLDLDRMNRIEHGSGVRGHEDLSRFIIERNIDLTKGIDEEKLRQQNQDDLIQGLSYEQAMAYYHWKFPIFRANEKINWQNYVFPSPEEFSAVQKGTQMIKPEQHIDYPTPTFRYVVHIYPGYD